MSSQLSYCGALVREQDPDRFLLSMFAPASAREALWALFAFNYEIAKTREVVTETQLGLIRLQWWREEIGKLYAGAGPPENETLKALAQAIQAHDLPQDEFDALIYAREFDLEDVLPADLTGLMNYADYTHAPLLRLALRACGDDPDLEPVQTIAVNYALAGVLRAVPLHAGQRRCYLPESLLSEHGVITAQLFEGKSREGLQPVTEAISTEIVERCKPTSRFLRATQALAVIYKGQIRAQKYDVFAPRMAAPPALKALRILLKTILP